MSTNSAPPATTSVFRVDKFVVPAASLTPFVQQIQHVQRTLGTLPGCRQKHVLTQTGGPSEFNVITVVEWADAQALAAAQAAVQKQLADEGFDVASFRRRLDVRGDSGFYAPA
ncbi:MAG: antibiotic biosynthesis monooxygenase [Polaromonas sp.]